MNPKPPGNPIRHPDARYQAISYAQRMGQEAAAFVPGQRRQTVHTVVIYLGHGRYGARYACEVAEDDTRQVWDSVTGEIARAEPF